MSLLPCVTLANSTTPVTNIGGNGGSSKPVSEFSDIVASTITTNPGPGAYGLFVAGDGVDNIASMEWVGPNSLENPRLYVLQSQPNGGKFDLTLFADTGPASNRQLELANIRNIVMGNTTYGNLNVSTVNGGVLQAGTPGAVTAVQGDNFKSILSNPITGVVNVSLNAYATPAPNPGTAVNYFAIQSNYSKLTSGSIMVVSNGGTFNPAVLKKGWYTITMNGLRLWIAQTAPSGSIGPVPFTTQALPGDLIEHFLVIDCGTSGKTNSNLQSFSVTPNTSLANNVYPQDSYLNLTGTFYVPAGAESGVVPTITLKTYYNAVFNATTTPPTYNGIWSYTLPNAANQNWIVIQPFKSNI